MSVRYKEISMKKMVCGALVVLFHLGGKHRITRPLCLLISALSILLSRPATCPCQCVWISIPCRPPEPLPHHRYKIARGNHPFFWTRWRWPRSTWEGAVSYIITSPFPFLCSNTNNLEYICLEWFYQSSRCVFLFIVAHYMRYIVE